MIDWRWAIFSLSFTTHCSVKQTDRALIDILQADKPCWTTSELKADNAIQPSTHLPFPGEQILPLPIPGSMSLGKVHLVRHAEGLHNLLNNPNLHDPSLTERGFYRAENLGSQFTDVNSNTVGVIITSPLRRTIQTSLTAFPRILDKRYYPVGSGRGGAPGTAGEAVELVLDADLQEIMIAAANTGSDSHTLGSWFPELDFSSLPVNWHVKQGDWSPDAADVARRVIRILQGLEAQLGRLQNTGRPDVVVVTHGGVIAELVPGLVMPVAAWKSFVLQRRSSGQLSLRAV